MLYPEERQQAIASLVAERGRLSVTAVAEQFGVTTETVRRDLARSSGPAWCAGSTGAPSRPAR